MCDAQLDVWTPLIGYGAAISGRWTFLSLFGKKKHAFQYAQCSMLALPSSNTLIHASRKTAALDKVVTCSICQCYVHHVRAGSISILGQLHELTKPIRSVVLVSS